MSNETISKKNPLPHLAIQTANLTVGKSEITHDRSPAVGTHYQRRKNTGPTRAESSLAVQTRTEQDRLFAHFLPRQPGVPSISSPSMLGRLSISSDIAARGYGRPRMLEEAGYITAPQGCEGRVNFARACHHNIRWVRNSCMNDDWY